MNFHQVQMSSVSAVPMTHLSLRPKVLGYLAGLIMLLGIAGKIGAGILAGNIVIGGLSNSWLGHPGIYPHGHQGHQPSISMPLDLPLPPGDLVDQPHIHGETITPPTASLKFSIIGDRVIVETDPRQIAR